MLRIRKMKKESEHFMLLLIQLLYLLLMSLVTPLYPSPWFPSISPTPYFPCASYSLSLPYSCTPTLCPVLRYCVSQLFISFSFILHIVSLHGSPILSPLPTCRDPLMYAMPHLCTPSYSQEHFSDVPSSLH